MSTAPTRPTGSTNIARRGRRRSPTTPTATSRGDGTNTFTYDLENRLVGRSGGVTLSYDPLGRLYEVAGGSGTTRFLYDGDALVAEYDVAGAMTRRYVHNVGADVPLLSYDGLRHRPAA